MSEHDGAPDPIDKAYMQAEAVLNDDEARAARRARVLDAIAREPATLRPGASATRHSPAWRRGGWLAAASVAGFGLFWAAEVDQSNHRPAPLAARTGSAPSPAPQEATPLPANSAKTLSTGALATAAKPALRTVASSSASASPPPAILERAPRAFPAANAPAAAPPPDIDTPAPPLPPVRNPQPESVGPPIVAPPAPAPAPAPPSPPAPPAPPARPPPLAARSRLATLAGGLPDAAQRLGAAASGGRVAEIQALLAQGVPVDAADAQGETALMQSVQADQPAAAALLRENGASLDQKNRAGLSARDMAKTKNDPELNQALGLDASAIR